MRWSWFWIFVLRARYFVHWLFFEAFSSKSKVPSSSTELLERSKTRDQSTKPNKMNLKSNNCIGSAFDVQRIYKPDMSRLGSHHHGMRSFTGAKKPHTL